MLHLRCLNTPLQQFLLYIFLIKESCNVIEKGKKPRIVRKMKESRKYFEPLLLNLNELIFHFELLSVPLNLPESVGSFMLILQKFKHAWECFTMSIKNGYSAFFHLGCVSATEVQNDPLICNCSY